MKYKSNNKPYDPFPKEDPPVFDQCSKFQTIHQPKVDLQRIVSYLYLKQHGTDAKTFSQRRICRVDSTQKFDGPGENRILQIQKNNNYKQVNGWQNSGGELHYEYDNGWKTNLEEICKEDRQEQMFQKHFAANEAQLKHDYKAKIENFKKYIQEINDMHKITDIKTSVKKLREDYRKSREQPISYIKLNKTRLFEILPLLNSSPSHSTLIEELQAFVPITDLKLEEKQKYLDQLYKNLKKETPGKPQRTLSQLLLEPKDTEQISKEYNQNHYLFEIQDVNSFGKQIRMNKMNSLMEDIFKQKINIQDEMKKFAEQKLNSHTIDYKIDQNNIQIQQQKRRQIINKEFRRMSSSLGSKRTNSMYNTQFGSTATSSQQFK
ncbi:hypothetical protein pb186bvf_013011 [Paramecium bursaria]